MLLLTFFLNDPVVQILHCINTASWTQWSYTQAKFKSCTAFKSTALISSTMRLHLIGGGKQAGHWGPTEHSTPSLDLNGNQHHPHHHHPHHRHFNGSSLGRWCPISDCVLVHFKWAPIIALLAIGISQGALERWHSLSASQNKNMSNKYSIQLLP